LLVSGRLHWDGHMPQLDGQPLAAPLLLGHNGLLTPE
jgi:hypothetical protein